MSCDDGREQTDRQKFRAAEDRVRELEAGGRPYEATRAFLTNQPAARDESDKQKFHAAEDRAIWWRNLLDETESRVRELEADLKAERDSVKEFSRQSNDARAENERLHAYGAAAHARVREMEAENERLLGERCEPCLAQALKFRKLLETEKLCTVINVAEKRAAEARLAAATALLRKRPPNRHDGEVWSVWDLRVGTFLANQPAARDESTYRVVDLREPAVPARPLTCLRTEGENGRGERCRLPMVHTGQCRFYDEPLPAAPKEHLPGCIWFWDGSPCICLGPPAAPTRTDSVFEVQGRSWPAGTHPSRTEVEQAVLDAMGEISPMVLESISRSQRSTPEERAAAEAEIARRELKP